MFKTPYRRPWLLGVVNYFTIVEIFSCSVNKFLKKEHVKGLATARPFLMYQFCFVALW